jgi:hypothetical protein
MGGPGADEGLIFIRASKDGYLSQSREIRVVIGGTTTEDFALVVGTDPPQ